jgi:hypothetical protein
MEHVAHAAKGAGELTEHSLRRAKRVYVGSGPGARPPSYIGFTLSTEMVSPFIVPVSVTFLPAESFTLS